MAFHCRQPLSTQSLNRTLCLMVPVESTLSSVTISTTYTAPAREPTLLAGESVMTRTFFKPATVTTRLATQEEVILFNSVRESIRTRSGCLARPQALEQSPKF